MKAKLTIGTVAVMLVLVAASAGADITVKSTVTSKGLVGLTNMEGTQTQMIAGDKAKIESNVKMTSKVMKMLGAGKPQDSIEITRIDRELFWDVNPKDKEYKERTFAEVRAEMEKALRDSEKEKAKYAKEHPEEAGKLQGEVKVERTGKSQKIAGYNTDEAVVTMLLYGKNSESGEAGAMKVTMDLWLAKDVPGAGDFQRFYSALAAKLGFTGHSQQSMEGMLAAFGIDPRELYKHLKDLEGMALMSTVSLAVAGEPSAQKTGQPEAAAQKEEKAPPAKSDEVSTVAVAKKLGGLLGKKGKESKGEESSKGAQQGQQTQGGQQAAAGYLMQFTSTVTEISSVGIAASEFEVPAGFKKK